MKIADRKIGSFDQPPYIVAEISSCHCGSLERAKELIVAAKQAGADAVKTQCYEADTITLNVRKPDFIVQGGLWRHKTLHELYKKAQTPFVWHNELYALADEIGITIFSSVFDFSAVDYLERLGAPAYKIASFEIVDLPLISYAARTGKPLIISTGMASDDEILEAREAAGSNSAFLHCTSEYPGTVEHASLGRIRALDWLLGEQHPIGVSDHTPNPACVPMMATALGAHLIEKHLKLAEGPKSEDDKFSLTPDEFRTMVEIVRISHDAMQIRPVDKENPSRQMRRSLYAVKDIQVGDEFTFENVRSIRPGYGLPPKMLGELIGRKSTRFYRRGDPIRGLW